MNRRHTHTYNGVYILYIVYIRVYIYMYQAHIQHTHLLFNKIGLSCTFYPKNVMALHNKKLTLCFGLFYCFYHIVLSTITDLYIVIVHIFLLLKTLKFYKPVKHQTKNAWVWVCVCVCVCVCLYMHTCACVCVFHSRWRGED